MDINTETVEINKLSQKVYDFVDNFFQSESFCKAVCSYELKHPGEKRIQNDEMDCRELKSELLSGIRGLLEYI